jgi:hypothetical protein
MTFVVGEGFAQPLRPRRNKKSAEASSWKKGKRNSAKRKSWLVGDWSIARMVIGGNKNENVLAFPFFLFFVGLEVLQDERRR